ncbi:MAG: PTS ascorbate transporter subunit IIC [Hungatella hathewayi]|nr:PTS ascorbate transporter subunit IIC [Hungatella hathewayi]
MVNFLVEFLSQPAIVMGLVAFIGLLVMKNSASTVISGTFKTILGFMVLNAGSGIICGALIPFSTMCTSAFGMAGVVPEDNALVAAVQTVLGFETPLIMLFSFAINLILARVTKLKYIFLTGHMMFSFAGTMAIVLDQLGVHGWMAVLIGSLIQGVCMVVFPAIAQPFVRKILKTDEVAFGFWGSSLVCLSGFVGGLCKKKNRDEETDTWEKVNVSEKFNFLKDMSILMSIVMIAVYVITALIAGKDVVDGLSGGQNYILYALLQGITFVAGVLVLLQGVRMFLGEIIPAFKGISEKLVPGARPALDIPIFYASGPMATTVGFLAAMVGGIISTMITMKMSVVVLPGVIGLFFMGGAAGVFGDKLGGKRGAVVSGLFLGFFFTIIVALAYPLIDVTRYGVQGLWFASTDAIVVSVIMKLLGMLFGIAV